MPTVSTNKKTPREGSPTLTAPRPVHAPDHMITPAYHDALLRLVERCPFSVLNSAHAPQILRLKLFVLIIGLDSELRLIHKNYRNFVRILLELKFFFRRGRAKIKTASLRHAILHTLLNIVGFISSRR